MRPDAVIFDVDGVLVDVRSSFLEAVKRTVQYLVVTESGMREDAPLVDDELIATFKRAGGFNNDWDLAHALTLWYLESGPARSTSDLRHRAGDPSAAARVSLRARTLRLARPTAAEVKGLMLELYWGSAEAIRLFKIRARLNVRDPLVETERILLRPETVDALRGQGIIKFGVLTGRLRVEWDKVRDSIALPRDVVVATDEDGRKPDPRVLRRIVERLGARRPCYVGDVIDDWRLVAAYRERFPDAPATGVFVVSDPSDEKAFRNAGATDFVRTVNDLPAMLARG